MNNRSRRINLVNKSKLVRWDADWYKELPEDDCIVCLTERQIYLIHEMLEPINWVVTRWVGDTSGLDFDLIKSNLQFALDERMTCEKLTQLIEIVENLQQQINILTDVLIEGDVIPTIIPDTTVIEDIFPISEQETTILLEAETCGAEGRDSVYAGVKALVDYITQANTDFLQNVSQAGYVPDRIAELISATPLGLLPFDEAVDWLTFISEELLQEYEATVDADLLEEFTCDLFCLVVANDCSFTSDILLAYLQSRVPTGIGDAADTLFQLIAFAATGTFAGDDYFWYFTYFQVWSRFIGQVWFGQLGIEPLIVAAQTGFNTPDNDWTLLCDECPELPPEPIIGLASCTAFTYTGGAALTEISTGVWTCEATLNASDYRVTIQLPSEAPFRIMSYSIIVGSWGAFRIWKAVGGTCEAGFGAFDWSANDMEMVGWTNSTPFTVQFTIANPP